MSTLEAFPRRVHRNVDGLPPSATVAINDLSNRLLAEGRDVIKLGLGQSPFPVPEPVVEALRRHAHEKDYLPVLGLPALCQAVADHHERFYGIPASPGDVLIGPGSKELMFLLQVAFDGDLVVPSPSWVSYAPQARIAGRRVSWLPTRREDGWHPTPELLDRFCSAEPGRDRVLVLNYPSNPTGRTIPRDVLDGLAEVCRKHRLLVLSDEIYGKVHHDGDHASLVPRYPEGTIFSSGLSKWCGAGGWRLGVFLFPKGLGWLRDAMAAVATETFTSTCAPVQHAAVTAFAPNEDLQEYLRHSRRVLKALGTVTTARLREGGIEVAEPQGGFYLFPEFAARREELAARGITGSAELCRRLLEETGVAFLPGSNFGRPDEELTARIAYVDFDGAGALEAVAALPDNQPPDEALLERHCGRVLEGARRITHWLNDGSD